VDITIPAAEGAVWWSCLPCAVDVELPAVDSTGFVPSCPECSESLTELWCWEPVAA
jgi:hypothetical protein